jgi:flagella basal body P-ring formation protein FlgA
MKQTHRSGRLQPPLSCRGWKPRLRGIACSFILLAVAASLWAQGTTDDRHMVTLTLQAQTRVDDTILYLDQIAKLSGGPANLRQRLARMDIAEFKLGVGQVAVTAEQVRFRILLAGVESTQFRVVGAKKTIVQESDDPLAVRRILGAAWSTARAKQPNVGPPRDIVAPVLDLHPLDKVHLEAKIPQVAAANGGTRVDVSVFVNGKMREIVPVVFDTPVKATFDAGLRPAVAITPKTKSEVLIKSRDPVRIVALVGPAQLVAKGEAQEDGRLGDTIRVRNIETNRTVNARVETKDVVVVEY